MCRKPHSVAVCDGCEAYDQPMQVARESIKHIPGAVGTAVHVLVAACHLGAFHDNEDVAPLSPASRLALASFAHTFLTYQAIAVKEASEYGMTAHAYDIGANSYTAPTRHAVIAALPCLALTYHVQALDAAESGTPTPIVPATFGSQGCESIFSQLRCPGTQQNTGTLSAASIVQHIPKMFMTNQAIAEGKLIMPDSRKAVKHAQHPTHLYEELLTDWDITCAIHYGFKMCRRMLDMLGYGPLLKQYKTLGQATKRFMEITRPPASV